MPAQVVISQKRVEIPKRQPTDYVPCLVDEDTPVYLDQYPEYTARLFTMIDQCNQQNRLISGSNKKLIK